MTGGVNKMVAMIAGAILVLIGLLGFVLAPEGELLGLFDVNLLHNLVHLLSGAVLLGAAFMNNGANARITVLVVGVVYALVAIVGFAAPGYIEGLVGDTTNTVGFMADNVLHLVLAVVFIGVPLLVKEETRRPMMGSPRV